MTTDMLPISTAQGGKTDLPNPPAGVLLRKKDKALAWLAAIFTHLSLGAAIWWLSPRPDYQAQLPDTVPIRARLVYSPIAETTPNTPIVSRESNTPSSLMANPTPPESSPGKESVSSDKAQKDAALAVGKLQPELRDQVTKQTRGAAPIIKASQALDQYFATQQHRDISELGKADAQRAMEEKNRPRIVDSRKGQPVFVPDLPNIKKVRCDNATNKVLTALSGYAGGTLRCSDVSDISSHIDKRLRESGAKKSLQ